MFVLRIEDTDQERSSLDSVRAILDALRWLGLTGTRDRRSAARYGPYFQSERKALYREAVERLIREGKAYRCFCTKEELDRQREALKAKDPKAQFVYPGTCRERRTNPTCRSSCASSAARGVDGLRRQGLRRDQHAERVAAGLRPGAHRRLPALQPGCVDRRSRDGHHARRARAAITSATRRSRSCSTARSAGSRPSSRTCR